MNKLDPCCTLLLIDNRYCRVNSVICKHPVLSCHTSVNTWYFPLTHSWSRYSSPSVTIPNPRNCLTVGNCNRESWRHLNLILSSQRVSVFSFLISGDSELQSCFFLFCLGFCWLGFFEGIGIGGRKGMGIHYNSKYSCLESYDLRSKCLVRLLIHLILLGCLG